MKQLSGNRAIILIIWLLAFGVYQTANATEQEIELAKGEQYKIIVPLGARFSVGNPEVIRVKPSTTPDGEASLLVQGKSLGYSDLILIQEPRDRVYKFQVFAKKSAAFAREVQTMVAAMPGISVEKRGSQWVLQGEAQRVSDLNKILALSARQPGKISFVGSLSNEAALAAQNELRAQLQASGIVGVEVRAVGKYVWIEGKVSQRREKEIAESIARTILPSIQSHIEVPFEAGSTIKFQVRIMEAIRSHGDATGFGWSTDIPKLFQVHKHFLKANFSLESSFQFLGKQGLLRMLSKPMIYVNEKGKAELRVGGEIPIKIKTRNRQAVSWKPYGLNLVIEVPGHTNGLTRAKITVEMSDLDYSNAIDDLPGIRVNRMETTVDLTSGKTVFLSGLLQSQRQSNNQGIALLKEIPILGELFQSRNFLERKSELLIAVSTAIAEGT